MHWGIGCKHDANFKLILINADAVVTCEDIESDQTPRNCNTNVSKKIQANLGLKGGKDLPIAQPKTIRPQ